MSPGSVSTSDSSPLDPPKPYIHNDYDNDDDGRDNNEDDVDNNDNDYDNEDDEDDND